MKYSQKIETLKLSVNGDETGQLIALESNKEAVPFDIKRVYYIYDTTPGTVRGHHAHKSLKQFLVATSGSCTIVCDDGREKKEFVLDWPNKALYIEGMIWRDMKNFSKGAVLMVLASEYYDEEDYIRDYEVFLKEVKNI
jgi:dTDP-4-dehydrorhamnose 3,5-epimerase-like enzyme